MFNEFKEYNDEINSWMSLNWARKKIIEVHKNNSSN